MCYEEVKDLMKTGDVIGWDGRNILHSAIDAFTHGDIGHVSQIIRLSEYEGEERRRFHSEATAKGVLPSPLSNAFSNFVGVVWWYPLKDSWNPIRKEIGKRMIMLMGRGYDYNTLFKMAALHPYVDERELICSEYVQLTLCGTEVDNKVVYHGRVWNPTELLGQDFYKERVKIYEYIPKVVDDVPPNIA